jgi:hypothetical protein
MMKKVLLLVAVVMCVGMLSGCTAGIVWNASFHETATVNDADKIMTNAGAKEVGKYTTFLGYNLGYETYMGLVSAELRKGGRDYHIVRKDYIFFRQTIGYIREN